MEKQLGWAHNLGGTESLGISKASQMVLAMLVESQIWHQLASSVGVEFSERTMTPAHLDARQFSFFLDNSGAFQATTPVLELRGSESELVSPFVCSLRGTAWYSSSFFH